jgi:hypothetical protein
MPVAMCEKFFYVAAMLPLFVSHRAPIKMVAPVVIDALLGCAFVVAYRRTPKSR